MVLTNDDYESEYDYDKGRIHIIKFKVKKIKQDDNYCYYEGISKDGSKERYISIKNNHNGFGGDWFKFTLENEEFEYVRGPWHDFSRDFIQ